MTQEFVESDSDDDTTQASGASTPSRRGSPSPTGGRRSKRTRSESSASPSPRHNTSPRRSGSQRPTTSASATSRPTTPPRSAPPAQKQARKVRFEQEGTTERSSESSTATKPREEKSAKSSATTTKDTSAKAKKDQKAQVEERPTTKKTEKEVPQTPVATTSVRMTSPKLDALAAVAKQAVQNLNKRGIGVKITKPPAKPKKVADPPVKHHQHPIPSKGRSAYVGKGKATAPAKKPPEVVKVSLQGVLGTLFPPPPEQKVPTSPRPTATIVPKPISATAEATTIETIQIDDESDKVGKAPELPPTTNVEQDLEMSQDSDEGELHGVCIVKVEEEQPVFYSDVEPDCTAEELAARQQQVTTSTTITTPMIPEILMDFQETVVISDDASERASTTTLSKRSATVTSSTDAATTVSVPTTSTAVTTEPGYILVTEPYRTASPPIITSTTSSSTARTPLVRSTVVVVSTGTTPTATATIDAPAMSTATTPKASTAKTTTELLRPANGQQPSTSSTTVDIPDRKPCRPQKPYNAVRKIKTTVPEPEPIPRPPEVTTPVRRHRKLIGHMKLANATLNYNISTDEPSRGFALDYSLNEGERYALRNDLRKMRLAQKALLLKIRAKFPINCSTEDRRQDYLNYFEEECWRVASRHSDSDDDYDIGPRI